LPEEIVEPTGDEEALMEVSVFELIEAFHRIVSQIDKKELMEIDLEKLSLTDIINEVMDKLTVTKNLNFEDLLGGRKDRRRIIYTFLALLELIKLRMVKAYQTSIFGVIRIFPAVES
jgi:segregation and condensation protein A